MDYEFAVSCIFSRFAFDVISLLTEQLFWFCIIHEKPHPKSDFFAHKSGTSRTILNGKSKLPALSSDFFAGSSVVSR